MWVSIVFTILLNIIINTADENPCEGDGIQELPDGNNPNPNFNNSPQGNYDNEKVNFGENYEKNNYNPANLYGGIRVVN